MRIDKILEARNLIEEADAVLITAGAGIGVDSGLPDFRGNEGFWRAYPAIKELGISFEEMANPKWFDTNPPLAWAFYGHRLNLYRRTAPHIGFKMLLDLVENKNNDYFIYTSNVDGQFQKAGFSEQKIVEVHGSIHHFQCSENCSDKVYKADDEKIEIDAEKFRAKTIPKCKICGAVARPNILMFGDWSWIADRTNEQKYRYDSWYKSLTSNNKKLVIIELGAGTAIPTIRDQGESIVKRYKNAKLIRINPRDYNIDPRLGVSIALGGVDGLKSFLNG